MNNPEIKKNHKWRGNYARQTCKSSDNKACRL